MSKNYLLTTAQKVLFIQPRSPAMQELKATLSQYNYEIIHGNIPTPCALKKLLEEESPCAILIDISMFQELLSYIKTINDKEVYEYQLAYGYSYRLQKKQLLKANKEILLSKNGHKLMELLVQNRGCTVSFEQILYHIWNKNYSLGSLRSLVYRIHEQLCVPLIENVKGVGYRVN